MYITATEMLKRYAGGERNFAGMRIDGVSARTLLCGSDLSKIILSGAYLAYINLNEVDLSGAKMIGAYLVGANLTMADLSQADLTGANLSRTTLISANLRSANLLGANLTQATLIGADLTYVTLEACNLSQVNLSRIKLYNNVLRNLNSLLADDALLWETTLPDGQLEPSPRYHSR